MLSKINLAISLRRRCWLLALVALGFEGSKVALAASASAPTAADDARLAANIEAAGKKLEVLNAAVRKFNSLPANAPGLGMAFVKSNYENKGDGSLVTTRMQSERELDIFTGFINSFKPEDVERVIGGAQGLYSNLERHMEEYKNSAVKYDSAGNKAQLTLNAGGQATRLSNVQSGALTASSTDAVNGSQLSSSNERIGQLGVQLGDLATRTSNDIVAAKAYSDANVVTVRKSIEDVQGIATQATQSVGKVSADMASLQKDVERHANAAVKYDDAGSKVQVTLNAGGEATRLSNVQSGELTESSTDAVNGSQLSSSNERISQLHVQFGLTTARTRNEIDTAKAYNDANFVNVRESVERVQGVATQAAQSVGKVSADVADLQKGVGGAFQTNARSNLRQPQASGEDAVAGGGAAQAVGDNSLAIGARARAEGKGAVAVGSDAKSVANNSVALGANSVADRSNTVSVGDSGAERQITNVAAGTRGADAANVSQLTRATAAATEQAHAYTDQRYAQLRHDLKQQDSTLSAGIAGAMAMANLPRSTVAGGSMTSVAIGNYRGESALAVGVSYVSVGGRWSTNFMGTTNTRNDTGAAVGVGYQW